MARLVARFLETNTFGHNLAHDWYIVDGQKYAVTREDGDYPLLCDSEGTPIARLDRTGRAIHPMQLRYNADLLRSRRPRERQGPFSSGVRRYPDMHHADAA